MVSLSHDVLLDVLCRLGVKDLLRFRCVSKPWCSSIDDPCFIKLHLSRSLGTNENLSLIILDRSLLSVNFDSLKTAEELNYPPDEFNGGNSTQILGSCNGLLALLDDFEEIYLWNPSTRKSQMLPSIGISLPQWYYYDTFLFYGLGYDSTSDDYKLVRMVQLVKDDYFASQVKVYSLKTNSWRKMEGFPYYVKRNRGMNAVFANNALHWLVSKKPNSDTRNFVVALDLGTEEYRVVELPDCLEKGFGFHMFVNAINGCLCVIAKYDRRVGIVPVIDIWMMKEHGVKESWIKLISVKRSKFVLPLAFSKNGDKVLLNFGGSTFVWYDLGSETVKDIGIRGLPSSFEVKMLVGSLVPLSGNGARKNKNNNNNNKRFKSSDYEISDTESSKSGKN